MASYGLVGLAMDEELERGCNLMGELFKGAMPDELQQDFVQHLRKLLSERYQGHWYPDCPMLGTAYRSVSVVDGCADPVLEAAWTKTVSNCAESELQDTDKATFKSKLEALNSFTIWIDPGEVTVRIGDDGAEWSLWQSASDSHNYAHSASCSQDTFISDVHTDSSSDSEREQSGSGHWWPSTSFEMPIDGDNVFNDTSTIQEHMPHQLIIVRSPSQMLEHYEQRLQPSQQPIREKKRRPRRHRSRRNRGSGRGGGDSKSSTSTSE